jgi:hypothetical protein
MEGKWFDVYRVYGENIVFGWIRPMVNQEYIELRSKAIVPLKIISRLNFDSGIS